MAAHSSILAWRIPRTEEPGRLQSMGSQRVGHDLATEPPPLNPSGSCTFRASLASSANPLSSPKFLFCRHILHQLIVVVFLHGYSYLMV